MKKISTNLGKGRYQTLSVRKQNGANVLLLLQKQTPRARDEGSKDVVHWMRRKRRSFCLTQLSSLKAVPFICLRKVSMEKENVFF